jgi:AraC-like DNA-binding protein
MWSSAAEEQLAPPPIAHPLRPAPEPAAVRRAREYLAQNLASNVRLAELAAVAGVDAFRLLRAFRKVHGVPPHRYQLGLRIERAKHLMRERRATLAAIALDTGFSDQSHLTRHFKRSVGVTPQVYARAVGREAPARE